MLLSRANKSMKQTPLHVIHLSALCSLAAVDDDVLWLDPFLQHALFRMLASAPEQPRRLDLEVADAFFVVVQQTVAVLIHYPLIGLFDNLQRVLRKKKRRAQMNVDIFRKRGR